MHGLSIGQLAKAAQVSIHTIRFYEKSGLLPHPSRRPSGFREYSELDVQQLKLIRRARSVGFSLEEIAEILAIESEDSGAAGIERKLAVVDRKIAELNQWRLALRALMLERASPTSKRHSLLDFFESGSASTDSDSQSVERESMLRDIHDED